MANAGVDSEPGGGTLGSRLAAPGPKRMLALDGGGVRGIVTIAFLEQIEATLRNRHGNPNLVLSDYFDMIGGTSVGSILATLLALGWPVTNVKARFLELCPAVFRRPSVWRNPVARIPGLGHYLEPRFDASALERQIKAILGDLPLGCDTLKTGLCVVAKRVDTGSHWVLTNNPRAPYWTAATRDGRIGNRDYRLADLVRASTAAPHYFAPKPIAIFEGERDPGLFVDGGVSPHNNPALQMLMLAGIKAYRLGWPLGGENLFMISIGTGHFRVTAKETPISALNAVAALRSVIADCELLNLQVMQWMSGPRKSWIVNSEVGDLAEDVIGFADGIARPLLTFQRYDLGLDAAWLKTNLDRELTPEQLDKLRDFTDPGQVSELYALARKAAVAQVEADDFPGVFDVGAARATVAAGP